VSAGAPSEAQIRTALTAVRDRIAQAAARVGRQADEITLVGVAKRKSAEAAAAAVRCGLRDIGENYVQEATAKIPAANALLAATKHAAPRWHFIGQLQRNKAGAVARDFDVIQTVDRTRLGDALARHAEGRAERLAITLQVNLSDEPQKGGVAPDSLPELLAASRAWRSLRVTGLMAIPAAAADPEASRPAFAQLRSLRDALRAEPGGEDLHELSMGMSQDFEVAIEEGATIVRVGAAIFGAR